MQVLPIDLNFQNVPGIIASFAIPHKRGVALVDCGAGSTVPSLVYGLALLGFRPEEVSDVFLTHIHLDHAGAAGWLAGRGARIHVHPLGAPHLVNPHKLLDSAGRIYGAQMQTLWGAFLPVPRENLSILEDGDEIQLDELTLCAYTTPGHADHHLLFDVQMGRERILFSGDVAGVRLAGASFLRLPMPPPELNLEHWRESLKKVRQLLQIRSPGLSKPAGLASTHFGVYPDVMWQLDEAELILDQYETWIERILPSHPTLHQLTELLTRWNEDSAATKGYDGRLAKLHEIPNPAFMSAMGIQRYWKKYRVFPNARMNDAG